MTSRAILSGIRSQAIRNNLIKKQQNVNYLLASMSTACANNGTKLQVEDFLLKYDLNLNLNYFLFYAAKTTSTTTTISIKSTNCIHSFEFTIK